MSNKPFLLQVVLIMVLYHSNKVVTNTLYLQIPVFPSTGLDPCFPPPLLFIKDLAFGWSPWPNWDGFLPLFMMNNLLLPLWVWHDSSLCSVGEIEMVPSTGWVLP